MSDKVDVLGEKIKALIRRASPTPWIGWGLPGVVGHPSQVPGRKL